MTASDTYTPDSELLTMNNLQVVEYLTATHHEFTRDSMAEISELIEKAQREIENPPSELLKLAAIWFDYSREMAAHLDEEEQVLFPWIEKLHAAEQSGSGPLRVDAEQVRQMMTEHKHHDDEITRMRVLGERLQRASQHSPLLMALSYKLKQLDADLREHMRIETEFLFPKILNASERQGCFGPIPSVGA